VENVFEKGIFIVLGTIAISNMILFVLSIIYSRNLFNELFEKILAIKILSKLAENQKLGLHHS
jgi:hypothetical protein